MAAWLWYQAELGRPWRGPWEALTRKVDPDALLISGHLCIDPEETTAAGNRVPAELYYSGNIYRKISTLKAAKAQLSEAQYERQLVGLEKAKPTPLSLSDPDPSGRLYITPRSAFAGGISVEGLATGEQFERPLNLKQAFMVWLEGLTPTDFEARITGEMINRYYFRAAPLRERSEKERFELKKNLYQEAQRLFQRFLHEALTREDQQRVEHRWNAQFNGFKDLPAEAVPVAFRHNSRFGFGGEALHIRPAQREGIAFTLAGGSGIIAYDVGVGKTLTSILTLAQELEAGRSLRPLVVVPKATYKKWKREIEGDLALGFEGLLPHVPVNDFYNLGRGYEERARGVDEETLQVASGSITLLTYEGFEKLGFQEATFARLEGELSEILEKVALQDKQKGKRARGQAALSQKIQGMFGAAQQDTVFSFEDFGFDYLVLDEAHNFKNIFTSVKGEPGEDDDAFDVPGQLSRRSKAEDEPSRARSEYAIQGTMSMRGLRAFLIATYIRLQGGGVQLLSATPFTNSPLEIYSMLALVAYAKLKARSIHNLKAFFDTFVRLDYDTKYTVRQQLETGQVIKGFNNRIILQNILFSFINYKTGEDAGLRECSEPDLPPGAACRPRKWVLPLLNVSVGGELVQLPTEQQVSTFLPPTAEQRALMQEISAYARKETELHEFCTLARGTCSEGEAQVYSEAQFSLDWGGEDKGRYLRAIAFQQNVTLSPWLYNCRATSRDAVGYRAYVESSPKLRYTLGCIASVKAYHEARGEPVSGQVIYMNAGVCFFPELSEYLVKEVGFLETEVAFLEGQNAYIGSKKADREEIKEAFNDGVIKVLIGSASIREGIDLQRKGTVLYLCKLDWNPTDLKQVEGRIWRFGNEYRNVRIVVPLIEDSVDAFLFQKLEEKTARINDIWNRSGRGNVLRLEEINPEEIKYGLITDLDARAQLQMEDQIREKQSQVELLTDRLSVIAEITAARSEYLGLRPVLESILQVLPRQEEQREALRKLTAELAKLRGEKGWYDPETKSLEIRIQGLTQDLKREVTRHLQVALEAVASTQALELGDWQGFNRRFLTLWNRFSEYADYFTGHQVNLKWDTYRKRVATLIRAERNVLRPYGLILASDTTPLERQLKAQRSASEAEITALRDPQRLATLVEELQAERERRNLTSRSVEERIEEFGRLNYLLSDRMNTAVNPDKRSLPMQSPSELSQAATAALRLRIRLRLRLSA